MYFALVDLIACYEVHKSLLFIRADNNSIGLPSLNMFDIKPVTYIFLKINRKWLSY